MKTRWACVARFGSIGDNLIASSVFPLIKRQGYMIDVMATEPSHIVFENNPYVDKITIIKSDDLPKNNHDWHQYFVKRSREYDKFYGLSYSIESALAIFTDSAWSVWPSKVRREWCNKSYLGFTHDLCEVPHEFAPAFFPTEEEKADALRVRNEVSPSGKPVIGWVLAGSRIDKLYPYCAEAIGRLISELGVVVVGVGGRNEKDLGITKDIQERVRIQLSALDGFRATVPLLGKDDPAVDNWPLRRSLSLLQACDLVISPDTGPAWAVASCAMPKIIMLGHASPYNITYGWKNTTTLHADQSRVPCHPCHLLHQDLSTCVPNRQKTGAACISDISVEQVVRKAKELLDARFGAKPVLQGVLTEPEGMGGDDGRRIAAADGDHEDGPSRDRQDRRRSTGASIRRAMGNGPTGRAYGGQRPNGGGGKVPAG